MFRVTLLALLLVSRTALAAGEWVSPDTPNAPPPEAPKPPKPGKAPPDCVSKVLEAIFMREKEFYGTKKAYSDSLLEIHALSAVGIGCGGWELPAISLTYGGSGYNAVMTETATGSKWTINQDKTVILEDKITKQQPAGK